MSEAELKLHSVIPGYKFLVFIHLTMLDQQSFFFSWKGEATLP